MNKKITVLIPCLNEEKGIANVIQNFPRDNLAKYGFSLDVLVIDNGSTDHTVVVAKKAGARVITEELRGKGNAMRRGFKNVPSDTDYVVMIDGDATYSANELLRLIEPLESNFCDVVTGSRLGGKIYHHSMPLMNRTFNWICAHMVRVGYSANVTDVLTGYFAWKKAALDELAPYLRSDGFAIEMEMITKMARLGLEVYSMPITYHPRFGESKIKPFDSLSIFRVFFENLWWMAEPRKAQEELDTETF